ncbi:MAG: hypothetical protein WCG01_04435 [bacterium]
MVETKMVTRINFNDIVAKIGLKKACYAFPGLVPVELIKTLDDASFQLFCMTEGNSISQDRILYLMEWQFNQAKSLDNIKVRLEATVDVLKSINSVQLRSSHVDCLEPLKRQAADQFKLDYVVYFSKEPIDALLVLMSLNSRNFSYLFDELVELCPYHIDTEEDIHAAASH